MSHHPHDDATDDAPDDAPEHDLGPSKSQLKRDAHDLFDLGAALTALPAHQLAAVPLADELRDAVDAARAITAHGARKRQLKYIGKLLRHEDPAPIRAALDAFAGRHALGVAHHHLCERWRDRLIAEGDDALGALLREYPAADRQHLRQLVRHAQAEAAGDKPPRSSRELFRHLRELIG